MNSKPFAINYFFPIALVAVFSLLLVSWGDQQPRQPAVGQAVNDTVPKNKTDKKIRDLDEAIDELNSVDLKVNMDKVKEEIEAAMKNIDMEKVKIDLDKVMKDVDMTKIKAEVDQALKEADLDNVKAEVEKAMKEVDAEKIEREVKESLSKVDMEKINEQVKKAMDQVSKIDMEELKEQMEEKMELQLKDIQPRIEEQLEKAKGQIEKAKVEMKEYKSFVDGLEQDGLINKSEGYTIQHKNGELIINGKKQPAGVYDKYRSFLEKHKNFTIKKSDDDFNISNDHDGLI